MAQINSGTSDAPTLVQQTLEKALNLRASDLHFEPTGQPMQVRIRIDGLLQPFAEIPKAIAGNVVARLKVLAHLLTYRNDIPQEGRLQADLGPSGELLDSRLSVFPTIHGERAVVRFFYRDPRVGELEQLGLPSSIVERLGTLTNHGQGLILLTGPAGSGKTTTLYALIRHLLVSQPGRSIITLEDPVEQQIDGTTQTQITPHGELTYPVALRSLLRQDPEVLMVGEIRDAQTAQTCVEAALSGHLLMSTLHAGAAAAALVRLVEMGIEPYQITSSVSAVINQRLIRLLCDACRGEGCSKCLSSGYRGRTAVAEMLELDGELRQAILERTDASQLAEIVARRGQLAMTHQARALMKNGVTTADEVQRVLGPQ